MRRNECWKQCLDVLFQSNAIPFEVHVTYYCTVCKYNLRLHVISRLLKHMLYRRRSAFMLNGVQIIISNFNVFVARVMKLRTDCAVIRNAGALLDFRRIVVVLKQLDGFCVARLRM